MKIKRYVADDLPQAVAAIRRELGREAVILSTRRHARPGWRRWFRRFDRVEVAAAVEDAAALPRTPPPRAPDPPAAPPGAQDPVRAAPPVLDVREPDIQSDLRQALLEQGLVPADARSPEPIVLRPGTQRLVALVGPTGAGKTTTLAKLAAHLHLQHGWRVALITADTFRVGAVEQLAAYARLLGLPLEVTPTPGALQRALGRTGDADVVLIDTSGRGHRDARRMQELQSFLQVAREVSTASGAAANGPGGLEVHLVLAAATRREEVEAVVAAYRPVVDRLLVTKLDECESPPEALAVAARCGLPLSYCTAGQRVPEDLAVAWPDRIAAGLQSGAGGPPARKTG